MSISLQSLLAAWTAPSNTPPTCNSGDPGCDTPLNISNTEQQKAGALILNTGDNENGLIVVKGKVGIGIDLPDYKLVVRETLAQATLYLWNDANNNPEIALGDGGDHWAIYVTNNATVNDVDDLRFWHGDDRMVIDDDGDVEIASLGGSGDSCLYADNAGVLQGTGEACGAGGGGALTGKTFIPFKKELFDRVYPPLSPSPFTGDEGIIDLAALTLQPIPANATHVMLRAYQNQNCSAGSNCIFELYMNEYPASGNLDDLINDDSFVTKIDGGDGGSVISYTENQTDSTIVVKIGSGTNNIGWKFVQLGDAAEKFQIRIIIEGYYIDDTGGGGGADSDWIISGTDMYSGVSGNVGIGTTSPSARLTVEQTSITGTQGTTARIGYGSQSVSWDNVSSTLQVQGGTSGTSYAGYFKESGSGTNIGIYASAEGSGTNYAAIFDQGNVGIGTDNPNSKLDISATGDGAELLRFSTERAWVFRQYNTGSSAQLDLHSTVGSKSFRITSPSGNRAAQFYVHETPGTNKVYLVPDGGRVFIGTSVDTGKKLHINGVIGFEGGTGPFCIFSEDCPNGWVDKGEGGYIYDQGAGASCPYRIGGAFIETWKWCHPKVCCNE